MSELRMPKGWIHVGRNDISFGNNESKREKIRREQKFNNAIRSLKPSEYEYDVDKNILKPTGLKKEGDAAAAAKQARKDSLMAAFNEKKLKSKSLIREAQGYAKKEKNKKQKAS